MPTAQRLPECTSSVYLQQILIQPSVRGRKRTMINDSIPDSRALGKFPFLHRLTTSAAAQRVRLAVGSLLSVALLIVLLWPAPAAAAHRSQAGAPADTLSANATVTIGPRTSTRIRLDAMRVDVALAQNNEGAWADVTTWLRFQNPLTRTLNLDVVVQRAEGTPPPTSLRLTVADVNQPLTADGDQRWRWATPLAGQTRLEAVLTYRVALGQGAAGRLRYETVRAWGSIGSARITVRFPEKPDPDQLLFVQPDGYVNSGTVFTWSYDNVPEIAPLDLAFLTTPIWRQLRQAQQDAAVPGATDAALTLGRWYARLARIESPQQAFFVHFYPQAVAALDRAWREAPERGETALLLADLYQQQADRAATEDEQAAYRALAAEFLAAARLKGPPNADRDVELAALYFQMAERAQRGNAWTLCAQFLDALDQLPAPARDRLPGERLLALRQFVALEQAMQKVNDGDLAAARAIVEQIWGVAALTAPGARRATFNAQVADVALEQGRQFITMTLPLRPAPEPGAFDMAQTILANLNAESGVTARITEASPAPILQMVIDFSPDDQLQARRDHLAAQVAANADLALLHALLASPTPVMQETESFFWRTRQISETVDLPQAQRVWLEQAARYQQAISALAPEPTQNDVLTSTLSLATIQRSLWKEEAAAWEALAHASEVRYRLTLNSAQHTPISQTAVGRPDQPLPINVSVRDYRMETVLGTAAGILLLTILAAWAWWRAG